MRRKINPKLKEYLETFAKDKTIDELVPLVNKKFNENYTRLQLQKYIWRNRIEYKYKNENKKRNNVYNKPIGSERTNDGMIQVKVANNRWEYKQRLIYEKYHNVKLKDDEFIIFLDSDRTNFNIDNLKLATRKESAYLGTFKVNNDVNKLSKEETKTILLTAKLDIKTKELKKR